MLSLYRKPEIKCYSGKVITEELGPCQNQYTTVVTLNPTDVDVNGRYADGSVFQNGTIQLDKSIAPGFIDELAGGGIRCFVGFDISSIQGTVVAATLKLYQFSVDPDVYGELGDVLVDHLNWGEEIDASDFSGGTLTPNIGILSTDSAIEWKPSANGLDVTQYVQEDKDAGRSSSQFRIRFTNDQTATGIIDLAQMESIENDGETGNFPELIVEYK